MLCSSTNKGSFSVALEVRGRVFVCWDIDFASFYDFDI